MKHKAYKLENGDYVKTDDEKDFQTVEYIDEIVQTASLALKAQRGKFYPDKNFGSHIKNMIANENAERVLVWARQALDSIDGVYVKNALIKDKTLVADLIINNIERSVSISFEADL